MHLGEALRFSLQALGANKFRTFLTALGLVIGNASVILVVTISLTSRSYILDQIQGIGSNLIYAQYDAGNNTSYLVDADFIKMSDVAAIRQQLGPSIVAAAGVITNYDRMMINGKEEDVEVIGSDEQYARVRNLVILAGRALVASDVTLNQKVALLTEKLAQRLYGSQSSAIGRTIRIHGLQFTVIGTFKEKTQSFGLSEIIDETILIPSSVIRYFVRIERVDPLYIQVRRAQDVDRLTGVVRGILESRHRPGARYRVDNLTAILDAAKKIATILTVVLILVSAIALIISGIGIMNIMLVTVTERTREIGLRMAVGASRREILGQFLSESLVISVCGGFLGILIGAAVPLVADSLTDAIDIPLSPLSVAVAFGVSVVVGLVFGILPANRAARLNPTEALRYE